jgi:hypothetical protein
MDRIDAARLSMLGLGLLFAVRDHALVKIGILLSA